MEVKIKLGEKMEKSQKYEDCMCCKMINCSGKVSDGVDFDRKKSSLSVCHGGGGAMHG